MPTSRQRAHMADMQLSVKEAKTQHGLKSVVEDDKEVGLICQQDKENVDRISASAFNACAAAELRGRVYAMTFATVQKRRSKVSIRHVG